MNTKKSTKILAGMSQICAFTGLSEPTVKSMIDKVGFPAKKLNGTWYSHTDAIEDWLYQSVVNRKITKNIRK